MGHIHTHYDTLKIARDAPTEVIRSAYRALARKYHPDSNPDLEEAVKAMQALNQAFEVLIDPVQRKAHDEWIDREMGGQAGMTGLEPEGGAGRSSGKKQQRDQANKFSRAGQFWQNWVGASKLTPIAGFGILALAAAFIALIVVALDSHDSSAGALALGSAAARPPTPAPTYSPTPAPSAAPAPSPQATISPSFTPTAAVGSATIFENGQELFPGIPNAWIIEHGLDHTDPALRQNDPDNDGFTNAEEFRANTNPMDSASKPAGWTTLRLVSVKIEKLPFKFTSLPTGDLETVAVGQISAENGRVSGATRFYKKGDKITLTEMGSDGRETELRTPFVFVEARLLKRFNPVANTEEEEPAITLSNSVDGLKIELIRGEVKDSPYPLATIKDTRPGGKELILRTGESFEFGDGGRYKLVIVSEESAAIEDLATGKRHNIPRLALDSVATPAPTAAQTPALEPSSTPLPPAEGYTEAISVDFGAGGAQRRLRADESAGVFRAAHWNSAVGASGEMSNLVTSRGEPTSARVTWVAKNLYQVQDVNTGDVGGDYTMMFGYLDTSDDSTTEVRFQGIPDRFAEDGYDLIVYVDGSNGAGDRVGRYEIIVQNSKPSTRVIRDGSGRSFIGSFVEGNNAYLPGRATVDALGNIVIFRNLKSDEFTLHAKGQGGQGFQRAPVNGIQIAKMCSQSDALSALNEKKPIEPLAKLIAQIRNDVMGAKNYESATEGKLAGVWIRDTDLTIYQFLDSKHGVWGRSANFTITYRPSEKTFSLDWGPRSGWTNTLQYQTDSHTLEGSTQNGDKFILRRIQ